MDSSSDHATRKRMVFISGSPRNGNTEALLSFVEERLEASCRETIDFASFYLSQRHVSPCTSCGACYTTGECIIDDAMEDLLALADAADLLVVGTPVYFSGVPAQLKAVYDRMQPRWARRYLLGQRLRAKRPAFLLITGGGGDPYGFEPAVTMSRSALAVLGFEIKGTYDFIEHTDSAHREDSAVTAGSDLPFHECLRAGATGIAQRICSELGRVHEGPERP